MEDTPKIRFKGFMDAWVQRKLGDLMNVTSVKRIHQSDWTDSGIRFLRARDIVAESKKEEIGEVLYISEEKYEEYSAISGKVQTGDMLVTGVGTIGVPMLITSDSPIYFKDGNIIWFKNENKIDGKFFYYSFGGNDIQKFIKESAGIGTVGTYTIESGKKTPINLPSKEEQIKIGEYFDTLDQLITLHQRKCNETIELKKYMLQKMFPKEGKKIPEIRFAGYTGAWERRKLGDMMSFSNGFNGSNESFGSGTALISVMDILNNDFITYETIRGKAKVSNIELERFKVEYGDVLFQRSSENVEDAGTSNVYLDTEKIAIFGGFVIRGKRKVNYDPVFIKYLLDSSLVRKQIVRKAQGAQHINVSQEILQDIDILYPLSEEDIKIGNLLRCLDGTITLHQRKCNKLKEVKKFMLQNMFPQKG